MKRSLGLWIVLALAATPLAAQSSEFGIWLAQSRVGETDEEEALLEFDNGDGYAVSYNKFFGALSLELSATSLEHDGRLEAPGAVFDVGSLDIVPIVATLQFHFARGGRVSPYIGGGLAYIMADDLQSDDLDLVDIGPVEVDDALTWAVQAGLDINLSERFAIAVDGKYTGYTPDAAPTRDPEDSIELDLNPLIISAGIKFRW
jgi:outer membrane protein W